jgi:DNA-binding response OmpR family regulator
MTQPPRILIADDDPQLVEMLALRCGQLGIQVTRAHSAHAALQVVERESPDLVILDVNMPRGNGLAVCEMLAGDERHCNTPVIVLTGQADRETVLRCFNLAAYYVPKCTDVWPRIEPLLHQLLPLDSSAAGSAITAAS